MQETAGEIVGVIRLAKQYDQTAFGELYRRSVAPVHRYLSVRLASHEEAEELTQEVFLAALSRIQTLRAEDEMGLMAWLYQIARHKLADFLRQRYRRPIAPLTEADQLAATGRPLQQVAEEREGRAALRAALEELTPEQREVIVSKFVLGYTNEQTARVVGKNVNAVNQLQHRGLASLHRLLTKAEKTGDQLGT